MTGKSLVISCSLCLSLAAGAQEYDYVSTPASREIALGSGLWLRSGNSAGIALDSLGRISDLSLSGTYDYGSLKSQWSGDSETDIRVATSGITQVGGMTLYGDFSYDYISIEGARYNCLMFSPSYDQPYYIADFVSSSWRKQVYDMGFRLASPLLFSECATLGFEARYKSLVGAKQVDPRIETYRYDLGFAPSVAVRLGDRSSVGLRLGYMYSFERADPSVENNWETPRVAIMRGLGFYTLGTAGGNMGFDIFYYRTNRLDASAQYVLHSPSADLLVQAAFLYGKTLVSENPTLPRMRGRTEKSAIGLDIAANLGRKKNHRLDFAAEFGLTSGYEYNQQFDNTPGVYRWITVSNPMMSTYDILEADARYSYYGGLGTDGEYDFKLGLEADFFYMDQTYLIPRSDFDVVTCSVSAFAAWNIALGDRHRLMPELSAGYGLSPYGEYSYGGSSNTDSEIVTAFYPSELRFLSSDKIKCGAGLVYPVIFSKGSSLCIRVHAACDYSLSLAEYRLGAEFGVNYLF